MSRARGRQNKVTASLFPFLAVLLSTMGVLVVLLVAMASVQFDQAEEKRTAQAQERERASESPEQLKLREELASIESKRAQVEKHQVEAQENLRDAQLRTSQIEANIRRWQDRLDSTRLAIRELQLLDGEQTDDREQAEKRLADLEEKIAAAEDQIKQLEAEQATNPKAYAILPYDGPLGTRRRPIYIECLRDRVIIQPEGITLLPADFHPELGAGNPLAAALRAAREYYAESELGQEEEPYPLILVRPEGVGSYRAVLSAISSWDSPFGYEMVGADWKLDFGAANPEVASQIASAVANSRERQAMLAKAAPSAFSESAARAFETQPGLLELVRSGAPLGGGLSASGGGGRNVNAGVGTAISSSPLHQSRLAAALQNAAATSEGEISDRGGVSMQSESADGTEGGQSEERLANGTVDGQSPSATSESVEANGTPGDPSQHPGGTPAMASASGSTAGAAPPSSLANSGETTPSGDPNAQGSTAVNVSPTASQGSASSGSERRSDRAPTSGLAVERPIQVVVQSDRLVVLHDAARPKATSMRTGKGRTVLLAGNGQESSKKFSAALKEHVEDWGIAGDGSYWKPVLVLNVARGGEKLADDLSAALRASGYEVRLPRTARR